MDKFVKITKKISTKNGTNEVTILTDTADSKTQTILNNLFNIVDEMNSTTSINEKRKIYKKKMTDQKFAPIAELIQLVYNPLNRFHVTAKNVRKFDKTDSKQAKIKNGTIVEKLYVDKEASNAISDSAIFQLLVDLSEGVISGDTALATVNKFRKQYLGHDEHVLFLVDKDLKMRFGITEINKILKDLGPMSKFIIPDFQVSLGYPFDEKTQKLLPSTTSNDNEGEPKKKKAKTASKVTGNWFISRKLDGIRCITIVKYNPTHNLFNVTFFSRKGLEFTSLGKIKEVILNFICPRLDEKTREHGLVLDGELCIIDNNGNEDFQSVMRELQKTGSTIDNPKYLIFDCLTLNEFNNLVTTPDRHLSTRWKYLEELLSNTKAPTNRLEMVKQIPYTQQSFEEMSKNIQSKTNPSGWEGLILRKDTIYQGKRSNDVLKVKKFYREEYKVQSIDTGKIEIFNDEGMPEQTETLTAVHILHKGFDVKVGSGFSHAERQKFFKDPNLIVGKIISVQYFEETKDKNGNFSLRFPTYLGLYGTSRKL